MDSLVDPYGPVVAPLWTPYGPLMAPLWPFPYGPLMDPLWTPMVPFAYTRLTPEQVWLHTIPYY
jgi:hypothetical protein